MPPDSPAPLKDGYTGAEPCLVGLLERAAHINATVLALPPEGALGSRLALLQESQVGGVGRRVLWRAAIKWEGGTHSGAW